MVPDVANFPAPYQNADGSKTYLYDNGAYATLRPDGNYVVHTTNGYWVYCDKNGNETMAAPTGMPNPSPPVVPGPKEPSDLTHRHKGPARSASVPELSSTPSKYKGKQVRVRGYFHCASKQSNTLPVLYAEQIAGKVLLSGGQVCLVLDDACLRQSGKTHPPSFFEKQFVLVEGVFEQDAHQSSPSSRLRVCKIEIEREPSGAAKVTPSGYGANYKPSPGVDATHVGDFPAKGRTSRSYAQ